MATGERRARAAVETADARRPQPGTPAGLPVSWDRNASRNVRRRRTLVFYNPSQQED